MSGGLYRSTNSVGDGNSDHPDKGWYGGNDDDGYLVAQHAPEHQPSHLIPQPVGEPIADSPRRGGAVYGSRTGYQPESERTGGSRDGSGTLGGPDDVEESDGSSDAATNSAIMAVLSLISRGTGFLRQLAITAAVGSAIGDAYTTAQMFPGMVYEFLLGGVLSSVLVPILVRHRKSDPDKGQAYTQRLLTLAVLALGVATALALLMAPGLTLLYAGGTPEAFRSLVTTLSLLMLPMLFFTGVSALISAVLNTRGHFAAPMRTPILNNLVVIGTVGLYIAFYGARRLGPEQMTTGRIVLIAGGTLLGVIVQTVALLPALRRVGFQWRWRFDFRQIGLREIAKLGAWMLCYVAVNQVGLMVLVRLLNKASAGNKAGPLIYNNVYLLLMMAHGIVAVSIITALMPRMSAAAADGRFADIADDLSRGTRVVTAVLAPIGVCYAVLASPIAVMLFNYGAFSHDDALATSVVLTAAAAALIPFAVSQLFTFGYYALADTKTPALLNIPVVVLRLVVQVGLFLILSSQFAAVGAMVANAISYVAAAVLSAWLLRSRVGRLGLSGMMTTFGKVSVAAIGAALAGLVVVHLLPGGAEPQRWEALLQLVIAGPVVGLSYLGLAMLLRIREINEVIGLVRRKLGR